MPAETRPDQPLVHTERLSFPLRLEEKLKSLGIGGQKLLVALRDIRTLPVGQKIRIELAGGQGVDCHRETENKLVVHGFEGISWEFPCDKEKNPEPGTLTYDRTRGPSYWEEERKINNAQLP